MDEHRSRRRPYRGKRLLDLLILAFAALPSLAIAIPCALTVALTSTGGAFFIQERVGMDGQTIKVWKFRTMVAGDNPVFPDASRITPVGRILRRTSLDELPQLINVLLGEMSIVGPRPTLRYQVDRYDDRQRHRLDVRPGLTGLAQVNGRNALSWSDRIDWDLRYVRDQSPRLDVSIIARTLRAMLSGEGVEGHPIEDPLAAPPEQ